MKWWWILTILITGIILVWFITSYISLRSNNFETYVWWENGKGSTYKKYFNIEAFASVKENKMWYKLASISTPPLAQLDTSQYYWIYQYLQPYFRKNVGGIEYGSISPYNLTQSFAFSLLDPTPDPRYSAWIKSGCAKRGFGGGFRYAPNTGTSGESDYFYLYGILHGTDFKINNNGCTSDDSPNAPQSGKYFICALGPWAVPYWVSWNALDNSDPNAKTLTYTQVDISKPGDQTGGMAQFQDSTCNSIGGYGNQISWYSINIYETNIINSVTAYPNNDVSGGSDWMALVLEWANGGSGAFPSNSLNRYPQGQCNLDMIKQFGPVCELQTNSAGYTFMPPSEWGLSNQYPGGGRTKELEDCSWWTDKNTPYTTPGFAADDINTGNLEWFKQYCVAYYCCVSDAGIGDATEGNSPVSGNIIYPTYVSVNAGEFDDSCQSNKIASTQFGPISYWYCSSGETSPGVYNFNDGYPDNFISRINMNPTSTILNVFFNSTTNNCSIIVGDNSLSCSAFSQLITPPTIKIPGGWIAFLQDNIGENVDYIYNVIYGSLPCNVQANAGLPNKKCKRNNTAGLTTGVSSALGVAGVAVGCAMMEGGAGFAIVGGLAALGYGIWAGDNAAKTTPCSAN